MAPDQGAFFYGDGPTGSTLSNQLEIKNRRRRSAGFSVVTLYYFNTRNSVQ